MKITACLLFAIFISVVGKAQKKITPSFKNELLSVKDSLLQQVLTHPEIYRYQIIYTKIDRDKNNKPSFTNYYYNVNAEQYFNPASTVKLPLAFLSLEKLNKLKDPGVRCKIN